MWIIGKIIKSCANLLCELLQTLYQCLLDKQKVPNISKLSEIIPVPITRFPMVNNNYRPVALTSKVMKSFEHIVKQYLISSVNNQRDPMQFAYCTGRSVQDAT